RHRRYFALGGHGRSGQPRLTWLEHVSVLQAIPLPLDVRIRRRLVLVQDIVSDGVARDAELRIRLQGLIVTAVGLRGNRLIALLVDEGVQMRGPKRMTVLYFQQLLGRTAGGHRITGRLDAAITKNPGSIRKEPPAQIPLRLSGILILVEPARRGMPHVHIGLGNRVALAVNHPTGKEQGSAGCRRAHDRAAVLHERRALTPEGPQQVRRSDAVVHQAHQRRQAERAGDQARLVVVVVGELPEPAHQVDRGVEFPLRETHLAGECMQMADQRLQDLPRARVGDLAGLAQHRLGNLLFPLDDHAGRPRRVCCGRPWRASSIPVPSWVPDLARAMAAAPRRLSRCYPCTPGGGENTLKGGKGPGYLSICTRQLLAEGPWASEEVPTSLVTALGLP